MLYIRHKAYSLQRTLTDPKIGIWSCIEPNFLIIIVITPKDLSIFP